MLLQLYRVAARRYVYEGAGRRRTKFSFGELEMMWSCCLWASEKLMQQHNIYTYTTRLLTRGKKSFTLGGEGRRKRDWKPEQINLNLTHKKKTLPSCERKLLVWRQKASSQRISRWHAREKTFFLNTQKKKRDGIPRLLETLTKFPIHYFGIFHLSLAGKKLKCVSGRIN